MKRMTIIALAGLLAIPGAASAATIGFWDFNNAPPDTSAATGTTQPAVGLGSASLVGGTTGSFATGSERDTATDNTGWSTAGYPSATAGNKTAGVQFRSSTRGYSNIVVAWEQRVTGSASRYARFQYSLDGLEFHDGPVVSMPSNNTYYARNIILTGISGSADNRSFAFRIVSEFESTATGSGTNAYVTPLGSSYSAAGTVRFDAVRITGDPLNPNNAPPTIEPIADLLTTENQAIVGHPIVIGDDATPAGELVVRVTSGNTNLIQSGNIQISGTGYERELSITPQPAVYGESRLTVSVSDAESLTTSVSFLVTVAPRNVPPTLSAISHQRHVAGAGSLTVPFVVSDTETPTDDLIVSIASSNPNLFDAGDVVLGGSGANRTLHLNPNPGLVGTAVITLRVVDAGGRAAQTSFVVTVVPTPSTLLAENFGYADGSLVGNTAGFWLTHAGTTGQVQVTSSGINLASSRTEDVHVLLPGGSIDSGALFASLNLSFTTLPSGNEYFAHLNHASSGFRARLYASTNDAAPGKFRLAIGNAGASGLGQLARDLDLNTAYRVVIRYDVSNVSAAVWINPTNEGDSPATATDTTTTVPIGSFAFRNASGIGAVRITELRLGHSFSDVTAGTGVRLDIASVAGGVEISWPATPAAEGYRLQSTSGDGATGWVDEPAGAAVRDGSNVVRLPASSTRRFFRLMK